jgi:hypothetical protein
MKTTGRRCVVRSLGALIPHARDGSDRLGEFRERRGNPLCGWGVESEFVVATPKVLHEGVPGDDHLRGPIGL